MKPKISICIPTFNRAELLSEALASIVMNSVNQGDLEVVVCDNASNDGTRTIVNKYQKKVQNLKYVRNKANIGPVRNLRKSIELAQSEFVWVLADDDVLVEGALDYLSMFLTANPNIDYIFYTREIVDYDLNPTPTGRQPDSIESDLLFSDGNALFSSCNGQMPYILGFFSSTIIRKRVWDKTAAEVAIISENFAWDHLLVILKSIRYRHCAILARTGVKARLNYRPVKASSRISFDDSIQAFIEIGKLGYSMQVTRLMIRTIIQKESRSFVVDKARGKRKDNIYKRLISLSAADYYKAAGFWGILSIFPSWLLKPIWKVYLKMR